MQLYRKEFNLLKRVNAVVKSDFAHFGINKRREIERLLYEISKRENIPCNSIIKGCCFDNFIEIKTYLLKRRFPYAYSRKELSRPYLVPLKLDERLCAQTGRKLSFYPKNIVVEKSAQKSALIERFRKAFPESSVTGIESLSQYISANKKRRGIENYNERRETVFIINENYDFFKKCPCTKAAHGCGYHIFNLSFGCIFECTYCFLQGYANSPGIIFPANIDNFFKAFEAYKRPGMRIGTGEFSDSLMLDDITGYSPVLIDFFRKHKDVKFEFKTKSCNIKNVLNARHEGNIVISWSLNPQRIIDENEFFASTLEERINAAYQCSKAGYKVGFHFDPVICFEGWQKEYEKVIELLFEKIKRDHIAWISIGTLRFNPTLKTIIETRFPGNKILDEELVVGYDNKLRYPDTIRYGIYEKLIKALRKKSKKMPVYLCMEKHSMWRSLKLDYPFMRRVTSGLNEK